MSTAQFTLLAVLSVLAKIECTGLPPVAGKCHTLPYFKTDPEQFARLASLTQFDIIYSTDNAPYNRAARVKRELTYIEGNVFRVVDTFTFTDQSTAPYVYSYNVTYVDFIGYEVSVDENGVQHDFRIYVLALYSDDLAVLYYRCSDDGDPSLDTRGLEISSGYQLSEPGLKYLLDQDSTYNFTHGNLMKLPINV